MCASYVASYTICSKSASIFAMKFGTHKRSDRRRHQREMTLRRRWRGLRGVGQVTPLQNAQLTKMKLTTAVEFAEDECDAWCEPALEETNKETTDAEATEVCDETCVGVSKDPA